MRDRLEPWRQLVHLDIACQFCGLQERELRAEGSFEEAARANATTCLLERKLQALWGELYVDTLIHELPEVPP